VQWKLLRPENNVGVNMRIFEVLSKLVQIGGLTVCVLTSMGVNAGLFGFGDASWKEDVQLHDGNVIVVKRTLRYGGIRELGQSETIKEQEISFLLTGGNGKEIVFKSEYSEDIGRSNLDLLALHILRGTPYIVTSPNLCLSYNKWGRPNPPYLIFRHDGKSWMHISIKEFPSEFTTINLALSLGGQNIKEIKKIGHVSIENVKSINEGVRQPEYKSIIRSEMKDLYPLCMKMVRTGSGWISIDWFTSEKTYDACLAVCDREKVSSQNCPCEKIFKKEDK